SASLSATVTVRLPMGASATSLSFTPAGRQFASGDGVPRGSGVFVCANAATENMASARNDCIARPPRVAEAEMGLESETIFMREALRQAEKAFKAEEFRVGAVVVQVDRVIARAS